MRKKFRKLTSVCLAVIMILSVLTVAPFTAGAAEDNGESVGNTYISGDFEYELLDDGTATITRYKGNATELVIPSKIGDKEYKVSEIGFPAFSGNKSLISIVIPDGVTNICGSAFSSCGNLKSVTIPSSVVNIGDMAFRNCKNLASITIPDGVTEIGNCAFEYCANLSSVTIPDSLAVIGTDVFNGTAWYDTWYNNQPDGLVYLGKIAFKYKGQMPENTSILLNDDTKGIADKAFMNCFNLISINIPDTVIYIGEQAFSYCGRLTSIEIPKNVRLIGINPFKYCYNLTNISVQDGNDNFYVVDGMLIGKNCKYSSLLALFGVTSPRNGTVVIAYPMGREQKTVTIPSEVVAIGELAFYGSKLENIIFSEGLKYINNWAFSDSDNLTSVSFPESLDGISYDAFYDCNLLETINLNEGIKVIDYYAFVECPLLKSIELPKVFGEIAGDAFYVDKSNGKKAEIVGYENTLAKKYAEDNDYTFKSLGTTYEGAIKSGDYYYRILEDGNAEILNYTGSDIDVEMPSEIDGYMISSIGIYAFSECSTLENITISYNVVSINGYAFYQCTNLKSLVLPITLKSIGLSAFQNCESIADLYFEGSADLWNNVEIDENNSDFTHGTHKYYNYPKWKIDENGTLTISGRCMINPDGYSDEKNIPWYSERESIKNVVIKDGITGIGNYSFYDCTNLESVSIPDSIAYIGEASFFSCDSLNSINISEGNENYTSIDGVIFNKDMTEIVKYPNAKSGRYSIPDTVVTIGGWSFRECANLTDLEIPDSVTKIDAYAFYDCTSLLSVIIPKSIVEISDRCGLGKIFHKSKDELIDGFTIYGYKGTAAETYANENGFSFIDLDEVLILGDVNGDRKINIDDVTDIQKYLANMVDFDYVQETNADVDKDGNVNIDDVTLIQKYLAGMATI